MGLQVHNLMENLAEQQEETRELSEAIWNPIPLDDHFYNDEVEAELKELKAEEELAEEEELNKQLIQIRLTAGHRLHEVPSEPSKNSRTK